MAYGTVLHLNLVGLMAAVEERLDASLRGRPFVVAREGVTRAAVLDLSPRAWAEGLRRGMPLEEARRSLGGLAVRPPRPDLYRVADEALAAAARDYSPLLERAGPGNLYLELRGTGRLLGPPEDASLALRRRIREDTGLLPALSLASNKTVSKVATRVVKPAGFLALGPGEEAALLARQPLELLPGVGPVLLERFALLELPDIGALAALDQGEARALGPRGPLLAERARGLDASPVDPEPPGRRVLRAERLFEPDTTDPLILGAALRSLVEELGFAARRAGLGATRVGILVGYVDGLSGQGATRARRPLLRDAELLPRAAEALERARARRVRVRRLALELGALEPAGAELDLFEPVGEARLGRLQAAVDGLRLRYGFEALGSAACLRAGALARAAAGAVP